MEIKGRLFSGLSSAAHEASMVVENGRVQITSMTLDLNASYAIGDLNIHERLGSIPRIIETPDSRRFETDDFNAVEALEASVGKSSAIHRLEREWKIAIPIAIALIVGVIAVYFVLIPAAARVFGPLVPLSVREQMSKPLELYLEKSKDVEVALKPEERSNFDEAVRRFKAAQSKVSVVRLIDESAPNAFILPNDHVYVTRGLAELAKSSDELLAVLLHEAGHGVYSHAMQGLIESSALSVLIVLVSGGTEWTNVPILVLQNGYSRQAESEADRFAIRRLESLKVDPVVFADIFERLRNKTEPGGSYLPTFMSTHPSFDERIKRIREIKH